MVRRSSPKGQARPVMTTMIARQAGRKGQRKRGAATVPGAARVIAIAEIQSRDEV